MLDMLDMVVVFGMGDMLALDMLDMLDMVVVLGMGDMYGSTRGQIVPIGGGKVYEWGINNYNSK